MKNYGGIFFNEIQKCKNRKFTSTETANMREVLYTIVHTAQSEVVDAVAGELNNELNEENAPLVRKLATVLKSF